jgi:hypothetical protein
VLKNAVTLRERSDPSLLEGLDHAARIRFSVVVDGPSYEVDRIEIIESTSTPANRD